MKSLKTAISVPEDIFIKAEETAKNLGMNRSRLYTAAISEFIEKHRDDDITARLNALYAEESSGIDPMLTEMQNSSLAQEVW
ncbi:MAG: ChpI protein [Deltaproteobacteria bacterium]|nr:ChpI protein [Deltaproteobacteria bacterium]